VESKKGPAPVPPQPEPKRPEPVKQITLAEPEKIKSDASILLERAPEPLSFPESFPARVSFSMLKREILRQSFIITARDDFGLQVRDGALGESLSEREGASQKLMLTSTLIAGKSNVVHVEQGEPGARKSILQVEFSKSGNDAAPLAASAQGLSRQQFANLLNRAGLSPTSVKFRAESTLGKQTADRIAEMTYVSQFAALRALHAEIKSDGASPELLGALIRAYANLGVLTEHFWVSDHRVYKARALLYAERLLDRMPDEPWALWHRAYARAMTGLHGDALKDITATANRKSSKPQPEWAPLIESICKFEDEKIAALADKPGLKQLALLLRFLVVEDPRAVHLNLDVASDLLEQTPDCTRVLSAAAATGFVGSKHRSTIAYLTVLAKKVPERVAAVPGLPETVTELLGRNASEPEIWKALTEASKKDAGDLPWSALSRMLREDRFVSIWRRAHFMRYEWGVPTGEFIEDVQALIADHPKKNVVLLHGLDPQRDAAKYKALADAVPLDDLDYEQYGVWTAILNHDLKRNGAETNRALHLSDTTYRDMSRMFRVLDNSAVLMLAREAIKMSPHGQVLICKLAGLDPTMTNEKLTQFEKDEGHQASVMRALGTRYFQNGKSADAERCWKAYLKRSPEAETYKALASIGKVQGKMDQWKATLDDYLKIAEHDLDYASVQVEIAAYLMDKKEWKEARRYADEAAATGAAWAMLCASRCCEGLSDWEKSESWVRAVSERYPENSVDWYVWCARTGKGDRDAAQRFIENHIQEIGGRASTNDLVKFGVFYTLRGKKAEAAEAWEQVHKNAPDNESLTLHVVLACDDAGRKEKRNKILGELRGISPFDKLAQHFRESLANGENQGLDPKEIDAVVARTDANIKGLIYFFTARFLERHGKIKEACEYYKRSSQTFGNTLVAAVCAARLRELEGSIPPEEKSPK